jgi:catechol 2,3-dioxygenase-like lactoylglutathione lyase family enzyme
MKVPFTLGEIGHFGLAVRDPKKSAKWFERALGLHKEFDFRKWHRHWQRLCDDRAVQRKTIAGND